MTSDFSLDSDGVIVYLPVCGLGKGNLIFQHSLDHSPVLYVNLIPKVRNNVSSRVINFYSLPMFMEPGLLLLF